MKLKCDNHDRRVMVLSNSDVIHREDGSKCDTKTVSMGEKTMLRTYMDRQEREAYGNPRVKVDPAQRLLYDVFARGGYKLHETEAPIYAQKGDSIPVGYVVLTDDFEFTAISDTDGTVNVYVNWGDDQSGDMSNHENMTDARRWLNTLLAASRP